MTDLNEIDIDGLEAGIELDILVADRVMGWQWYRARAMAGNWMNCLLPPGEVPVEWLPGKAATDYESPYTGPRWSANITAAWTVLNKFGFYNISRNGNTQNPLVVVSVPGKDSYAASGKTIMLAICRAALKAVRESQQP